MIQGTISQFHSSGLVDMPWWAGKGVIRDYLKKVNENGKVMIASRTLRHSCCFDLDPQVLEYTLFQPGLFLEYLATPYKTAKHLTPLNTMIDYEHRRAIVVDGHDAIMNLTTVQDLAAAVVGAVNYDGEWPVVGGICGNRVAVSQILKIGGQVRGMFYPPAAERLIVQIISQAVLLLLTKSKSKILK